MKREAGDAGLVQGPATARGRPRWAPGVVAVVLAAAALTAHASAQTMIEPERVVLAGAAAGKVADAAAMRRAVLAGAAAHAWALKGETPGLITLQVGNDVHRATVDVVYDGAGFQIKYRDSFEMDYAVEDGRRVVHPRYNKWISDLSNDIRRAARYAVRQRTD